MAHVPTKYDESKHKFIEPSYFIETNYSNFCFFKTTHMSIKKMLQKLQKL
jgi:hypothetical protein